MPRVVRVRSGLGNSQSMLIKEHGEGGAARAQEVIKRG